MLETHLDRIAATTFYAEAQSNNHILSESIALLLGGYLLNKNNKKRKYHRFYQNGRKLIQRNIGKLILEDGCFAQYSIVYHRMILDLVCVVEIF